ncbi:MAG: P1 family peptidase [Acidimicrobiia bacterium]
MTGGGPRFEGRWAGEPVPGGLTSIDGVQVGHRAVGATGVTVVLAPEGTTGSGEVRGGAPASRETELLDPLRTVSRVDAVTVAGGSAFGLAAADGVMRFLAERGRGQPTPAGPVPIVPALAVFDLLESGGGHPGADDGYAAAAGADADETGACGRIGAGRAATVGAWRGSAGAVPGGLGQAARRAESGADGTRSIPTVAALAVVNAYGDVVDDDGSVLAGSGAPDDAPPFAEIPLDPSVPHDAGGNTTIVVVATDADLDAVQCSLVAQSAHHGLVRSLSPSHTRFDGDAVVVIATGAVPAHIDRVRVAATAVTADAVRSAVRKRSGA